MSGAENSPDDVFDVDRIRRLVELMEDHDLREVDLRQAEQRIRLRRGRDPSHHRSGDSRRHNPHPFRHRCTAPAPAAARNGPARKKNTSRSLRVRWSGPSTLDRTPTPTNSSGMGDFSRTGNHGLHDRGDEGL